MEKGIFVNIRKTKNGKITGQIKFENGKYMTIPSNTEYIDESLNNKSCEVLREKGVIEKINYEGKQLYPKIEHSAANSKDDSGKFSHNTSKNIKQDISRRQNNFNKYKSYNKDSSYQKRDKSKAYKHGQIANRNFSKAPYNFIQLNDTVIEAQELPRFDSYLNSGSKKRHTGYIDCELETITPLYIRDTYTAEELREKEKDEGKNNSDFFSPGGKVKIPGSSLRGMIRTLTEIIGWGNIEFREKGKRLFYREVAGKTELAQHYASLMIDKSDDNFPKVKAGILKKEGSRYKIYPSKIINGTQIYKINYDKNTKHICGISPLFKLNEFEYKKVYFKPVYPKTHIHKKYNRKLGEYVNLKLKYAKVTDILLEPPPEQSSVYLEGYLVSSGDIKNIKHMHWIINALDTEAEVINIDKTSLEQYKSDINRHEDADLMKMLDKLEKSGNLERFNEGIPCFYIVHNEKHCEVHGEIEEKERKNENNGKGSEEGNIFFGHTGMFRLPYEYKIDDYIPDSHKMGKLDFAQAIFGSKDKNIASRIYFEDAKLMPGQTDILYNDSRFTRILEKPKPTAYQHYLKPDIMSNGTYIANHWNSKKSKKDVTIRGNKLYWHKDKSKWELNETDSKGINPEYLNEIKPVKANTKFKFKIRYENLTKEELGLLLIVLDLPEGHYHKLGMGKPLGLGTVHIEPTLYISDRRARYSKLFDGNTWNLEEKEIDIEYFKRSFEKFLLAKLEQQEKDNRVNSLWELNRMQQLKTMLNWGNTKLPNWLDKTEYIELRNFDKRKVLPEPNKVISEPAEHYSK